MSSSDRLAVVKDELNRSLQKRKIVNYLVLNIIETYCSMIFIGCLFFPDLMGSSAHPPAFFGFGAAAKSNSANSSSKELFLDWELFSSESPFFTDGLPLIWAAEFSSVDAPPAARRPFLAD